ncbi:MAG: SDR family oxidoreductase [Pelagimonas sp.]|nr:SDR family oxidoreductase [Pelagimonas sp.]
MTSAAEPKFAKQVVLITGAASGFGQILARRLADQGAHLVLGDINLTALQDVAGALGARYARCDVTCEADQKALVDLAIQSFGRLDIAVNNAGIAPDLKPLTHTTEEDMDRCYAINTKGVFFGMKHQLLALKTGGCILNTSSVAGINGAPKLASYAASKHAVIGLTKTAAAENARKGIRVNAICPFYSPTPLVTEGGAADMQEFLAQASPMKRLADPNEVASAMISLISPDNSYMTGQAIAVDGGVMAL